ncbi:hypothetical protein [Fodinibius roseus]|nr:hypothetical protein [Fodinibius roseus]
MGKHNNFADQLSPDQVHKIFSELGIRWRDKPKNGDWVNNVENPNIARSLSVNIRTGGYVPHFDVGSNKYDEDIDYNPKGDIVKLVRIAKGFKNRTEAIKWINQIIGHPARSRMHFFSVADAELYGIKAAVILQNLRTYLDLNLAAERNIRDGRVWTYNSREALSRYHPYLSTRQIRYRLEKLIEQGVLIAKKYYKKGPTDHRLWYSINEPRYQVKNPIRANEQIACSNGQIMDMTK